MIAPSSTRAPTSTWLRAVLFFSGVAAVALACGGSEDKGRTPAGGKGSCTADSDCAVTSQGSGCCQACVEAPRAIPTLAFEQHKNRCAEAKCPAPSDRIECPKVEPLEAYVAKCKEGTCAAVKR